MVSIEGISRIVETRWSSRINLRKDTIHGSLFESTYNRGWNHINFDLGGISFRRRSSLEVGSWTCRIVDNSVDIIAVDIVAEYCVATEWHCQVSLLSMGKARMRGVQTRRLKAFQPVILIRITEHLQSIWLGDSANRRDTSRKLS